MNTHQLRWLSSKLAKRNNKWYAALEQSGLSGSNFLFSLLIIKVAGVADLGVYSFWFVVCQFMAMLTMGLATRQMVLQLSSETFVRQIHGFWATCQIVMGLQVAQAVLFAALVWMHPPTGSAIALWVALVLYSASLNFAELYRQYYYLQSRHRHSLWFSGLSLTLGVVGFLLIIVSEVNHSPEISAFWFLAVGNLLFVLFAHRALRAQGANSGVTFADTLELCRSYWRHGIPATSGMLVTWMQNQSVVPLLMFMFGPLSVGYYSVARMIVTPVNMVTTGLSKSALPQIRRAFGDGDNDALDKAITAHCRTSMNIVYYYVAVIAVAWVIGRYAGWIETGDALIPLFVATVLVMALSNYRFWVSQNFVVRLQFGILLTLGIVASILTLGVMLVGGLALKSALWVVMAPAVGEIFLIVTLRRKQKSMPINQ
ncbi:lipopolysaccharide biosynthesis protein [Granulosicoccus antarcticus]|uniref:Polysaccharide biosynthesis protein C-terminal domain-containing protein n=1 Tax=Granulosicoccus antarcticus IMCC3135 TaxID=1192854 RepID=A0A2Z2P207_9GAMM|nr:hypothetical protein [Granulosicoccus antarcticus]ASJ74537.1 hypothetical protein IMCC3135_22335 [Granulosicoccus antarcticus IMCC3135]